MYIIYLALGLIMGEKMLTNMPKTKKESKEKAQVAKVRKSFTTYISNNDSNRQIKPENININLNPQLRNIQKASTPNFIALTVLWSHFQAMEEGILKENLPAPWEQYKEDKFISNKRIYLIKHKKWKHFLQEIITDKSWTKWINDPEEVRKRSMEAYKKLD